MFNRQNPPQPSSSRNHDQATGTLKFLIVGGGGGRIRRGVDIFLKNTKMGGGIID